MSATRRIAPLVSSLLVSLGLLFLVLMIACGGSTGTKAPDNSGSNASGSGSGSGGSSSGSTSSGTSSGGSSGGTSSGGTSSGSSSGGTASGGTSSGSSSGGTSSGGTSSSGTSSGGTSSGTTAGGSTSGSGNSGSGASSGGTTSGGGSATTAALAYVAGSNNNFYGVRVDTSSNISQTTGSPYSLPGQLFGLAAGNGFVFASAGDIAAHSISMLAYRADANGALTLLSTTTEANDDFGGLQIALDSSGKFLYLTGGNAGQQLVYGFSFEGSSGRLTPLGGSPWSISNSTMGVSMPVVAPNGRWLCMDGYYGRTNDAAICYARHGDGTLDPNTYVHPISSATGFGGLAITRDSNYVLGTTLSQNSLEIGLLSGSASNSVPSGGQLPLGVATDPSGHYVAVANNHSDNIAVFAVDAAGRLTQVGSPVATGSAPGQIAFSPSGSYLFADTQGGTVVFSFNSSTGALTPLNASNPAPGASGPIAAM